MKVNAYAKINITLDIPGIREDGYHELRSVFQTITLHDELDINVSDTGGENEIFLTCNKTDIPCNENNLCWKAANTFLNEFGIKGKRIAVDLYKNIPSGAGLGGGSSDCAETLKALRTLLEVKVSDKHLEKIGVKLGADVPFFIKGGAQLAEGIGEKLTALYPCYPTELHLVIAKPKEELLSGNIYKIFDTLPKSSIPESSTDIFLSSIKTGGYDAFRHITNMLEPAAKTSCAGIERLETLLTENGALRAMMTGSGSAVFGIFENKETALKALNTINNDNETVFGTLCRFK